MILFKEYEISSSDQAGTSCWQVADSFRFPIFTSRCCWCGARWSQVEPGGRPDKTQQHKSKTLSLSPGSRSRSRGRLSLESLPSAFPEHCQKSFKVVCFSKLKNMVGKKASKPKSQWVLPIQECPAGSWWSSGFPRCLLPEKSQVKKITISFLDPSYHNYFPCMESM